MKALEIQGKSRDTLPYKAPFQPWGSWFALGATSLITIFKGFDTFMPWNPANFVTYVWHSQALSLGWAQTADLTRISCRSYVAIPIFIILWAAYKFFMKTRVIPIAKIDLVTGLRQIDEEEKRYLEEEAARGPRTRLQRIWDGL